MRLKHFHTDLLLWMLLRMVVVTRVVVFSAIIIDPIVREAMARKIEGEVDVGG